MKKILLCSMLAAIVLFSGCEKIDNYLEDKMIQKAGITETSEYQEYQTYAAENKLDQNGYYQDDDSAEEEETVQTGSVHVTFFDNSNLNVHYFSDSDCQITLDTDNCYLNLGDIVYATVEVKNSVSSNMYVFDRLDFYDYDESGYRSQNSDILCTPAGEHYTFTIPADYERTELEVAPKGSFEQRVIELNDYYLDAQDQENALTGTWTVNDQDYTEDQAQISPVTSYVVSYQYDNDEYFYVSSSPECYYSDNDEGIVIFKQSDPDNETESYAVELHPYLSVSIPSDEKRYVEVNGGDGQNVENGGELSITKLKYGDTVVIRSNMKWNSLENYRDLILTSTEKEQDGYYKYTLIVPEKNGEFTFDPSKYRHVGNGKVYGDLQFKCFGEVVDHTEVLAKGSTIYYELVTEVDGYWLGEGEHKIVVGDEEETQEALENIQLVEKTEVRVDLPQPKYGGQVVYKMNGDVIEENSVAAFTGSEITMDFAAWNGWSTEAKDGATYTVNKGTSQTITVDGKSIDSIFDETKEHQPKLTVVLGSTVGKEAKFTVQASGLSDKDKEEKSYASQVPGVECTVINGKIIGTAEPIQIAVFDKALKVGEALRIKIVLVDQNNKKTTRFIYTDDLTEQIEAINIYDPSEIADSEVWYKSIRIKISVVDAETFSQPAAEEHTTITVKNMDTGENLEDGDLLEASQQVKVRIKPEDGYYIDGQNVTNDAYSGTMLYSEYLNRISKIIKNHPVAKYVTLTLDESDEFADYTYTYDGKTVSGTIQCRQGIKLQLLYKITDSSYQLTKKNGGVLGIGATKKQATKTITITAELDGTTITKESFGLSVKKKG